MPPMVMFYSDRWENTPAPEAYNEMRGRDLAQWFHARLRDEGYDATAVIEEDYGFGIEVKLNNYRYWIVVYDMGRDETQRQQWMISVDVWNGCLKALLPNQNPPRALTLRLAETIDQIIRADDSVQEITWWQDDMYKGTPTPHPPRE